MPTLSWPHTGGTVGAPGNSTGISSSFATNSQRLGVFSGDSPNHPPQIVRLVDGGTKLFCIFDGANDYARLFDITTGATVWTVQLPTVAGNYNCKVTPDGDEWTTVEVASLATWTVRKWSLTGQTWSASNNGVGASYYVGGYNGEICGIADDGVRTISYDLDWGATITLNKHEGADATETSSVAVTLDNSAEIDGFALSGDGLVAIYSSPVSTGVGAHQITSDTERLDPAGTERCSPGKEYTVSPIGISTDGAVFAHAGAPASSAASTQLHISKWTSSYATTSLPVASIARNVVVSQDGDMVVGAAGFSGGVHGEIDKVYEIDSSGTPAHTASVVMDYGGAEFQNRMRAMRIAADNSKYAFCSGRGGMNAYACYVVKAGESLAKPVYRPGNLSMFVRTADFDEDVTRLAVGLSDASTGSNGQGHVEVWTVPDPT